ncbi:hypothetical protein QUA27_21725 [Microcoleus sp. Pol14C6]
MSKCKHLDNRESALFQIIGIYEDFSKLDRLCHPESQRAIGIPLVKI